MLRGSLVELCWAAFLLLLLSRCFLSLSWLLAGTPSNSSGVFGTFLGRLLGLSRGSWALSWAFLALLGLFWAALFGLSSVLLDSLGMLLGVPFRTSWPKRRPGSDKVPQDSPKSCPRDSQGSQSGRFLGRLAPQNLRFRLEGPSKTLLPLGHLQERKRENM